MITQNDFTRVKNTENGNPRLVCHFLSLTMPDDLPDYMGMDKVSRLYDLALSRAKPLGGRKFHNKQFGGGIVFSTYNLRELCEKINKTLAEI